MKIKNCNSNDVKEINSCWAWCLLFGGLYFLKHGIALHFIAAILLAVLTCGASWLVYPVFAKDIVLNHYINNGWVKYD